jgi:(1->4)-alpha-D-glucan 1-alpha-D-glucosylmutase
VLLLRLADDATPEERAEQLRFLARFQQTSGPVMAKGVEDTAFYVYNRLISLNDVGGDPDQFGISVQTFHRLNLRRREAWPFSILASSTHDTKRSEDVRARINVLSEMPREWAAAIQRWSRANARFKSEVDGRAAPDRNEEYLLYQTLLGAWPLEQMDGNAHAEFTERIVGFMRKALREAKVNTSWISPNEPYETAVEHFARSALEPAAGNAFIAEFEPVRERVARYGLFNSLSQTVLKLTSPGVPDFYQGTEIWDFSLVDPDNRRPVDYEARVRLLQSLEQRAAGSDDGRAELVDELLQGLEDGRAKLFVIREALRLRREVPELFRVGEYIPLHAVGEHRERLCAFSRRWRDHEVLVIAPRGLVALTRGQPHPPLGRMWTDTALVTPSPVGTAYRDAFSGQVIKSIGHMAGPSLGMADALRKFPIALLKRV